MLLNLPTYFTSILIAGLVSLCASIIFFGPALLMGMFTNIKDALIEPATSRLIQTVAENRQPFFIEWSKSFGPIIKNFPLFFWLFFVGSTYMFNRMIKSIFRIKERMIMIGGYLFFLSSLIFSRYSSESALDGTNNLSLALYALGFISFIGILGIYYYKYSMSEKKFKLKKIDFNLLFLFLLFFLGLISARAAIRFVMVLVPSAAIMVAYFMVSVFNNFEKITEKERKIIDGIIFLIILTMSIFSGIQFYKDSNSVAKSYVPSVYHQQWQKSMSWIRENTDENSVFGHWWDYGYWIQSIGERATILDGGNVISYWNHLMGRQVLTGQSLNSAEEFLYAHNGTHLLIDSTDIGKYHAFSSIGSNADYDRRSWINTFLKDSSQTIETKNKTTYLYRGNYLLDEDLIYEIGQEKIFLPGVNHEQKNNLNVAGLGGILLSIDEEGNISQPIGLFIYKNKQYRVPLKYLYYDKLINFENGLDAGAFIFPKIIGNSFDENGAMLYLSKRVVNSNLAKLYLYGQETEVFELAHSENDIVVESLKSQGIPAENFVYYQGFRGPIKIWKINYSEDIQLNQKFLETKYPEEIKLA